MRSQSHVHTYRYPFACTQACARTWVHTRARRCVHVLLPHDERPREPGSLRTEINPPGLAPDPTGTLSALPDYALCPTQPPSLAPES